MTLTFESNVYLYITSTDLCTRITVSNERVTHVLRFWAKGVKLPGNSEYQCPEVYLFGRITIRDISRSIYLWYSALLIFMFVYWILFYFILCYRIVCFVSFAYDCFFFIGSIFLLMKWNLPEVIGLRVQCFLFHFYRYLFWLVIMLIVVYEV